MLTTMSDRTAANQIFTMATHPLEGHLIMPE